MSRRVYRSLSNPEVLEDVQFLVEVGRPYLEISERCSVAVHAIEKKFGKRKEVV